VSVEIYIEMFRSFVAYRDAPEEILLTEASP
jgi:hypothetical protein